MIGVLVTFTQTDEFDRSSLAKFAEESRGTFEGMPGLRSKSFTLDEDGLQAGTSTSGTTRRKPVPSSRRNASTW